MNPVIRTPEDLFTALNLSEQTMQLMAVGAFGSAFLIFLAIGVILNYHWVHYGISSVQIKLARVIYFGVSGVLLAGMLIMLFRMW